MADSIDSNAAKRQCQNTCTLILLTSMEWIAIVTLWGEHVLCLEYFFPFFQFRVMSQNYYLLACSVVLIIPFLRIYVLILKILFMCSIIQDKCSVMVHRNKQLNCCFQAILLLLCWTVFFNKMFATQLIIISLNCFLYL